MIKESFVEGAFSKKYGSWCFENISWQIENDENSIDKKEHKYFFSIQFIFFNIKEIIVIKKIESLSLFDFFFCRVELNSYYTLDLSRYNNSNFNLLIIMDFKLDS